MRAGYRENARGLIDGGADILLVETVFDTLNAKAALFAIEEEFEARGWRLPVICSGTDHRPERADPLRTDTGGVLRVGFAHPAAGGGPQLRAGQHADETVPGRALRHFPLPGERVSQRGAAQRVRRLRRVPRGHGRRHPRHGRRRPRQPGRLVLRLDPRTHARHRGGGARSPAAQAPGEPRATPFSRGLEAIQIRPDSNFVNVGERTNVTGSARFRKLIQSDDYEAALEVARQQVENGAQIIDVNMDEGMLDSVRCDAALSQPDCRRTGYRARPDHDRQFQVRGHRGRPAVRPGQVRGQFHQPQGRRRRLPRPWHAVCGATAPRSS